MTTRLPKASFERVRRIALALPGGEDGTSYGTPAVKVRGKLIARLKEPGVIVVGVGTLLERDFLIESDPAVFFITDHYRDYPAVLVRLAVVKESVLREMLQTAWRRSASAKQVAEFDAR